jgi:3-oxoacyl-[acyl-carrier-protein] synthase III
MSLYAHITGWGMTVPTRVVTNEELAQKLILPTNGYVNARVSANGI